MRDKRGLVTGCSDLWKKVRVTDPQSGDVEYTDDPVYYKGRWYAPFEGRWRINSSRELSKPRVQASKDFTKMMKRFRDSR